MRGSNPRHPHSSVSSKRRGFDPRMEHQTMGMSSYARPTAPAAAVEVEAAANVRHHELHTSLSSGMRY